MANSKSAVATPDGINFGDRVIGFSVAIRQLDSGHYDKHLSDGLRVLACIQEAKASGWVKLTVEKEITIWRWLVATIFLTEERERNGTASIANEDGGTDTAVIYMGKNGGMSLYPAPERFALASNVEGLTIEKYGPKTGLELALRMYQDMVTPCASSGFKLSAMGREGLEILHDSLIEAIQQDGMPDMPVMH